MLKAKMIPMQVYLPPELVQTYKTYALAQGESFAEVLRQTLEKNTPDIQKKLALLQEKQKSKNKRFLKMIREMHEKYKDVKDHYPHLTHDELLYGGKL